MSDIIQIGFDIITATVHQQLDIINEDWDEDKIIDGLNDGTLATSTWYDHDLDEYQDVNEYVDIVKTGEHIAVILSQEIDGEYIDYR